MLQNIFMQIWLTPQQFASPSGSLIERLGLLARNLAIEIVRRPKSNENPSVCSSFDPISHTLVCRLMQKPHALVLLLPDADRQVLEMAFFDGKTPV